MNLITYTSTYPNAAQPQHGLFVEQRLRKIVESGRAAARVVAPVPWFPFPQRMFGRYAQFAAAPARATRFGIDIVHPRYAVVPKVGMSMAPFLMAAGTWSAFRQAASAPVDLIDAHFFYPDGVAAAILAERLGKPLVVTARGTDISLMPRYAVPRRLIRWAAARAAAIITVCQALKEALVELGVPASKITVLRNGVDTQRFRPSDRGAWRRTLGMEGFTLLSVGELIKRKANEIAIQALSQLPDARLFLIGQGPEEGPLRGLAGELGVSGRVRFLGPVAQDELRHHYSAADALVLSSSREGLANVLLESMACGTPVIASNVWGTPEVVCSPEAGVLMEERTPQGLARAVRRLRDHYPAHADVRRHAERFSWDATTRGQLELYASVIR